jgi:hypothetical protein
MTNSFIPDALGIACGVLGWPPDVFWRATPLELKTAFEGFCRFHGIIAKDGLNSADVQALRAMLEEA